MRSVTSISGSIFLAFIVFLTSNPVPAKGADPAGPEEAPGVVRISIVEGARDKCEKAFDPPVVTVPAGTTVEWIKGIIQNQGCPDWLSGRDPKNNWHCGVRFGG